MIAAMEPKTGAACMAYGNFGMLPFGRNGGQRSA
jgi:hypothetical protein